jgi:GTP-binding protein
MRKVPTIAIVGRPNVGKSAIFNRMVGRRIAIVHDEPGVTRDRISAPCQITTLAATVIDTGGIGATLNDTFADEVATEADVAMNAADLILFVVDCRDHLTPIDQAIAAQLHQSTVPVFLVLNKADNEKEDLNLGEFTSLGFHNHIFISAAHGRGFKAFADLLDQELKKLNAPTQEEIREESAQATDADQAIRVAVVGRPNAGKSSLINAILNDKRTIVSSIAGTTRDAIDIPYSHDGKNYQLIDTAGMRPRSKRDTSVEVFSAMRSEKAIRRSDICLLVIDISLGITQQDRRIAGIIAEEGKPCIIVINKFDLFHPTAPFKARMEEVKEQVKTELFFLNYAPFLVVSALQGEGIDRIFSQIRSIQKTALNTIGTGALNRLLQEAMQINPPSASKSLKKRLRLYYATTAIDPKYSIIPVPRYVLFVNDKNLLSDSYAQYLRNAIRQTIPAPGIPILFSPRSRIRKD